MLLSRDGGNGSSVELAVSEPPAGVTATFDAVMSIDGSAALSIDAASSAAPGTYTLDVTGTAAGLDPQTVSLTVTVVAAPSMSSLTVPFCAGDVPPWLAVQNEGYHWERVQPSGAAFTFDATQNVGMAYLFQAGSETQMTIVFATSSELATFSDRDCSGERSFTGTVAGVGSSQTAIIAMGASLAQPSGSEYTLSQISERPLDLVATAGTLSSSQFLTPSKVIVRRDLDPPDNAVLDVLDFTSAEAFAPELNTVTIGGLTGEIVDLQNTLFTGNFTYGHLHSAEFTGASGTVYSVPAASLAPGDLHELFVDTYQATSPDGRSIVRYFDSPANQALEVGAKLSASSVRLLTGDPYVRQLAALPLQADYGDAVRFVFVQGQPGARRIVLMLQTAGYTGGTPDTWELLTPDLTAAAGFSANWMLSSGQLIAYSATAFSGRAELLIGGAPVSGDVIRFAYAITQGSTIRELRAISSARPRLRRSLLSQYLRR